MNLELFIWNYALFILAIFWGPRADDMGTEGRGVKGRGTRVKDKGRGPRVKEHKHSKTSTFNDNC